MHSEHHKHFQALLAAHGITDTRGVEIMRMTRMLANIYEMIVNSHMREDRLSGPRLRLLLHLYMAELNGEHALSPTKLSKMQNVSKNTVSSFLRSLEEQGLIERAIDPVDRRQFRIQLSDRGREFIRTSAPGYVANLNQIVSDLTSAELDQLTALMKKLHQSLVHHGDLSDTYCPNQDNDQ